MANCLEWFFTLNGTNVSPGNGNRGELPNTQIDLGDLTYSCNVIGNKIVYEVFVDIGLNSPFSLGTIETDSSFGATSLNCNTFTPTFGILGSVYEGDASCEPLTPTTTANPNNSYSFHFCISCTRANGISTFEYDAPIEDINNFSQFGTLGTSGSNVSIYGLNGDYWLSFREDAENPASYKNYDIPEGCLDQPIIGSGPGCTPEVVVTQGTLPPTPQNCSCNCPFPPDFQTPAGNLQIGDGDNIISAPCAGDNCVGTCRFKQTVWFINNGIAYWTHLMGGIGAEGTGSNCECGTTPDPCGSATWCWNEPMKCIAFAVCENAQVGCEECKGDLNIFTKKIPLRIYNKLTGKSDNLNSTIWVNNGGSLAYYFAQGTAAPDDPDATAELGEYITTIDLPDGCCGDRALHVEAVECECDADPVEDCGITELTPNPAATTCEPGVDCLVVPCRACDNPYCEPHDPPDPTTPDNRPWGVGCVNGQCVIIRGGPFPDGPTCGAAGCLFNPPDENPNDDPPPPPPPDPEEPTPPPEPPPPEVKIICKNGSCQSSIIQSINGIVIEGYASMEECEASNCSQYGKYSYICVSTNGSNSCEKFEFEDPLTGYQSLSECEDFCLVTTTESPNTTTTVPTTTTLVPTTTTATPTTTTETPATSTTSSPSGGCPQGYEACGGESTWSWMLPDGEGGYICAWTEVEPCPEGCTGYPPEFIPTCEDGQQQSANGLCCRPTTTTENPVTTTEEPTTTTPCPAWYQSGSGDPTTCVICICTSGEGEYQTLEDCLMSSTIPDGLGGLLPFCENPAQGPL